MINDKLKQHSKLLNVKGVNNKTAVMFACKYGHYDVIKYLVKGFIPAIGNTPE